MDGSTVVIPTQTPSEDAESTRLKGSEKFPRIMYRVLRGSGGLIK